MATDSGPVGQLAGLGNRMGAWVIDTILASFICLVVVVMPMLLVFVLLGYDGTSSEVARTIGGLVVCLLVGVVYFGYFILMEGLYGATVGKKLLSIRVVGENGGDISMGASAIRNILRIVDSLPFAYILGIALIAINDDEQRVGDIAGSTYVVKG